MSNKIRPSIKKLPSAFTDAYIDFMMGKIMRIAYVSNEWKVVGTEVGPTMDICEGKVIHATSESLVVEDEYERSVIVKPGSIIGII